MFINIYPVAFVPSAARFIKEKGLFLHVNCWVFLPHEGAVMRLSCKRIYNKRPSGCIQWVCVCEHVVHKHMRTKNNPKVFQKQVLHFTFIHHDAHTVLPPSINIYINSYYGSIHPIVSFHGLALLPLVFPLAEAVEMGWVCCKGLWVNVCLSGPKTQERTFVILYERTQTISN